MYNWKLMLGLILGAILLPVSIASSEPIATTPATISTTTTPLMSPYDLVFTAYQGYFREQGLRGYGVFIDGCNQATLTPRDVVQAAIRANRLPESVLSDRGYMSAVDANMKAFKSATGR